MFKGALSRYSVILGRFFAVENGGEKTRGRSAGQREAGLGRTFFSSPVPSFVIDRRRGISQLPLQSHSSFGRSWALRYDQEVKTIRQVCP